MATQEQIQQVFGLMQNLRSVGLFRQISQVQAGIGAVLHLLAESQDTMTAGKLAESMGVSTARIAVLLKKMETKGLIIKGPDPRDGRVTVVRLSPQGERTVAAMQANLYANIGAVIDRIGMERMLEFTDTAQEICQVMKPPVET